LRQVEAVAARLESAGRTAEARLAHLDAVRLAAALGRADVARRHAAALRGGRGQPLLAQAHSAHAEALARLVAGDTTGASRAAERGLRLLDEHRALLGATELRAEASGHGAELAAITVGVALLRGPAAVLAATERWRAGAVRRRPVLPADLDDELGTLRRAIGDVAQALADGADPDDALARQAQAEALVRRRARRAAGAREPMAERRSKELLDALGERALVELVEHAGVLHAVVLASGRATLHPLGAAAAPLDSVDHLSFALRRLGRARGTVSALDAARASAQAALAALDAALVGPLRRRLGERPVVLVPTAALFAVPWAVLPTLADRPVAIAPSAMWWTTATAPRPGQVVLAAGPGLPGAADEVRALATLYSGAAVLTDQVATAGATAAAIDGAAVAHLACHGRFRCDNPMFSCLELADGPLTVYDLERLATPPSLVVLSACDSGVPAARPGDELLGLVGSLLALGTSAIVASVVPVPDLDTAPLMLALHTELAAGRTLAEALQRSRLAVDPESPTGFVARAAFACFGAG
jgi:hypothetical protein